MTEPLPLYRCVEELKQVNLMIRRQIEQAESWAYEITDLLDRVATLGLFEKTILLGEVVHDSGCAEPPADDDMWTLTQAALLLPGGAGVVTWGMNEYLAYTRSPEPMERKAMLRFIPFDDCEPAIRALLMPQIELLLNRACDLIRQRSKIQQQVQNFKSDPRRS